VNTWNRVVAAYRTADGGWEAPSDLRKGYGFVRAAFVDARGGATVVYESDVLRLQRRAAGGAWHQPVRPPFGGRFAGAAATPDGHVVLSTFDDRRVVAHERPPGQPWLGGVTVGRTRPYAEVAPVVVDGRDRATIGFAAADESAVAVRRVPGGTWTEPDAISPPGVNARVIRLAQGPGGRVALTWVAGSYERPRLWVATRSTGAPWSSPIPLTGPRTRRVHDVATAFQPDGDLVVVWTSELRRSHDFYLLSRTVSSQPAG
jgi:hypothetical protein